MSFVVAWACAKLEYKDDEPMRSLTGRTWEILDELSGQNVSNLAWACAKLEYKDDELMRSLTGRAWKILDTLNGQEVSNLACFRL